MNAPPGDVLEFLEHFPDELDGGAVERAIAVRFGARSRRSATESTNVTRRSIRKTSAWPGDIPLAREEFQAMAAVLAEHMKGRRFIVGNDVTAADLVMAYTLDWANEVHLLDAFPELRTYMERMYARPKAPPRIAEAFASIQA